jgi:replicative DNA helicase
MTQRISHGGILKTEIMPYCLESEVYVLGSLIINPNSYIEIAHIIKTEMFFVQRNQIIFDNIVELINSKLEPDIKTLFVYLHDKGLLKDGIDGYYLGEIIRQTPSTANILYHTMRLNQDWVKRKLITQGDKILKDTGDVLSLYQNIDSEMQDIGKQLERFKTRTIKDIAIENYQKFQKFISGEIKSLKSGFYDIDDIVGAFYGGDFIIIAARPSMGKTAFALSMAYNMVFKDNLPVLFMSLEMTDYQLSSRLCGIDQKIDTSIFRSSEPSRTEFNKATNFFEKLMHSKLSIDICPGLNELQLKNKVLQYKSQYDIQAVFIDYIQLMQSSKDKEKRVYELATISHTCKELAIECDIPIIAMAQLNRDIERRANKTPMLADLRECCYVY